MADLLPAGCVPRRGRLAAALRGVLAACLVVASGAAAGEAATGPSGQSEPGSAGEVATGASAPSAGVAEAVARRDFETRLDALRNALIDAALAAPTRVSTAAWIDENGRLHESSRFVSEVRVRGVRVETYMHEAGLSGEAPEPAALPVDRLFCEIAGRGLKRQASLALAWQPGPDGRDAGIGALAIASAADALLAAAESRGAWLVSPVAAQSSGYERLISAPARDRSPYRMVLSASVAPAGADPVRTFQDAASSALATLEIGRKLHRREVRLGLAVRDESAGVTIWRDEATIAIPRVEPSIGSAALPEGVADALARTVSGWIGALDEATRCAPLYFSIVHRFDGRFVINGGLRAGLRIGDKLVLADRTRLPARVLERGALEQMVLAEVDSIREDSAVLRRVAGAERPSQGGLVAMPL